MAKIYLKGRVCFRHDTAENWETNNPVLEAGEVGVVDDFDVPYHRVKIGDGITDWNNLEWWVGEPGLKGEKGDKGEQGIQGEKGEKGDKGDPGETPDMSNYYTKTETNNNLAEKQDKFGEVEDIDDGLGSKAVTGNVVFYGSEANSGLVDITNGRIGGLHPWIYNIPEDATFGENDIPNVKYVDDAIAQAIATNNENYNTTEEADLRYLNVSKVKNAKSTTAGDVYDVTYINAQLAEKPYELIETITLEDITTSIIRNAEPDSTPYNFRAVKIVAVVPATNPVFNMGNVQVLFSDGQTALHQQNQSLYWTSVSTSTLYPRYMQVDQIIKGNNWLVPTGYFGVGNTYTVAAGSMPSIKSPINSDNIKYIALLAAKGFLAGTVIKIYGVRAE
jgi:hypothetical protein